MPIIKSAIKRMRQSTKRNRRNVQTKRNMKTATKDLQVAIDAKDAKKAAELLLITQSAIDTAAKKNVIHKNKASRLKSNYNAKVKALGGKPATKTTSASKSTSKKPVAKSTTKATPTKKAPAKKPASTAKPRITTKK